MVCFNLAASFLHIIRVLLFWLQNSLGLVHIFFPPPPLPLHMLSLRNVEKRILTLRQATFTLVSAACSCPETLAPADEEISFICCSKHDYTVVCGAPFQWHNRHVHYKYFYVEQKHIFIQ